MGFRREDDRQFVWTSCPRCGMRYHADLSHSCGARREDAIDRRAREIADVEAYRAASQHEREALAWSEMQAKFGTVDIMLSYLERTSRHVLLINGPDRVRWMIQLVSYIPTGCDPFRNVVDRCYNRLLEALKH